VADIRRLKVDEEEGFLPYLLPVWEKVARTKSATDEGDGSARSL
jgi:hypothetical protein